MSKILFCTLLFCALAKAEVITYTLGNTPGCSAAGFIEDQQYSHCVIRIAEKSVRAKKSIGRQECQEFCGKIQKDALNTFKEYFENSDEIFSSYKAYVNSDVRVCSGGAYAFDLGQIKDSHFPSLKVKITPSQLEIGSVTIYQDGDGWWARDAGKLVENLNNQPIRNSSGLIVAVVQIDTKNLKGYKIVPVKKPFQEKTYEAATSEDSITIAMEDIPTSSIPEIMTSKKYRTHSLSYKGRTFQTEGPKGWGDLGVYMGRGNDGFQEKLDRAIKRGDTKFSGHCFSNSLKAETVSDAKEEPAKKGIK